MKSLADMTVKEILERHPGVVHLFVKQRMLCLGCPAQAFHTLAEVARIHALPLDALLAELRSALSTSVDAGHGMSEDAKRT